MELVTWEMNMKLVDSLGELDPNKFAAELCDNCDELDDKGVHMNDQFYCHNCIEEAWNLLQGKKICERL